MRIGRGLVGMLQDLEKVIQLLEKIIQVLERVEGKAEVKRQKGEGQGI